MKYKLTFGDFYLATWCLYLLQGTLYDPNGILGKMLLVLIMGISIYYVIYANIHYKLTGYFKALNALVILFGIYGVFNIIVGPAGNVPSFYYIKQIYLSFLPIYVFYVLVKQGRFSEDKLRAWILVFAVVATASFYKAREEEVMSIINGEQITNNAGYIFLSILPLTAFYNKKPLLQSLLMAYCSFFIFSSVKRGAILIAAIVILLLAFDMTRHSSNRRKVLSFVLVISLFIGMIYFVQYLLLNSDLFGNRVEQTLEGDSSNRDIIYSSIIDYIFNSQGILSFLFGKGADATLRIFGGYAHNDWLEIAVNNGLLGVILYAIYYMNYFKTWLKSRNNTSLKIVLGTTLIVVFLRSLISMSYSNTTIYTACAIGYCMAMLEQYKPMNS